MYNLLAWSERWSFRLDVHTIYLLYRLSCWHKKLSCISWTPICCDSPLKRWCTQRSFALSQKSCWNHCSFVWTEGQSSISGFHASSKAMQYSVPADWGYIVCSQNAGHWSQVQDKLKGWVVQSWVKITQG